MRLEDCFNDYLLHIRHERGLSPTTCEGYASWLRHYLKWLDNPDADLSSFSTPFLRRYLYDLSKKGLRPRSILSAFFPLKGLAKFLVENGVLAENPASTIKLPKKDAAQRLTVTTDEVLALLDAVERVHCDRRRAQYRALLNTLGRSGAQCAA